MTNHGKEKQSNKVYYGHKGTDIICILEFWRTGMIGLIYVVNNILVLKILFFIVLVIAEFFITEFHCL